MIVDYQRKPETVNASPAKWWKPLIMVMTFITFLLAVAVVMEIIMSYPVNHGGDPRVFWPWCVAAFCTALLACTVGKVKRRWGCVLILSVLVLAALIWAADHYNLMLGYERWCKRGMPAPGL